MPSCIRLPPVAISDTTGSWRRRASARAARIRAPASDPTDPPMYRNSNAIRTTSWPATNPVPQSTDSASPLRAWDRRRSAA